MQAKSQGGKGASRDEVLKSLAAAFDSFMELKSNLEEGTKVETNSKNLVLLSIWTYMSFKWCVLFVVAVL